MTSDAAQRAYRYIMASGERMTRGTRRKSRTVAGLKIVMTYFENEQW